MSFIVILQEKIAMLEREVAELRSQISKNSRNSSKPPSSDGYQKPQPKSLRVKSGLRPGGQRGHKGETLKMRDDPDEIVVHRAGQCERCGCSLDEVIATGVEKRQVFDLPPMEILVIEHQSERKRCPCCGHESTGLFPEKVTAPVQYGFSVRSIAVYLQHYQLLPFDRTREFFEDVFSVAMSSGTLANIVRDCSERVEGAVAQVKEQIREAAVAHFDESGISVEGKLNWLHVASTGRATHYDIHAKRGSVAMDEIGILPEFEGRAMHDFWKPYLGYACDHGLCNAHLLRELVFLHEDQGQKWAKEMIGFLIEVKSAVDEARLRTDRLPEEQLRRLEKRYKRILGMGRVENPYVLDESVKKKRGRPKKSKAQNLLDRFDRYPKEVLAFMYDFRVPFDNNLSERDIRMIKLRMKISGTFRSEGGAKAFCRITAISNAFAGHPFIPAPSPGT